jgi:CheY-like chemotaxis protein
MESVENLHILYVEDDPAHAEFTIRNFRKHQIGKEIIHVDDGLEALDYLFYRGKYSDHESAPRPELIVLDLRLPKIDGLEVLKKIKEDEELHCIPVIILTTSEADTDISRAYKYHANSYLQKPLDSSSFSNMIGTFGHYWEIWNKFAGCNDAKGE